MCSLFEIECRRIPGNRAVLLGFICADFVPMRIILISAIVFDVLQANSYRVSYHASCKKLTRCYF